MLNMTGQRFGRLVVVGRSGRVNKQGSPYWLCRCDCGGETATQAGHLRNGHTQSCGCHRRDRSIEANTTHGASHSPEYLCWSAMKARCLNSNHDDYHLYGGRGITICDAWLNDFAAFRRDMGKRPAGHTVDRIDADGNYEPSNCRWARQITQVINRRRKAAAGLGVQRIERKHSPVFVARIGQRYLGTFASPEQARAAYEAAALDTYGPGYAGEAA